MKAHISRRTPGRPRGKSGLPPPVPGEPFSLIGTLRRTRSTLTVADVAELLQVAPKTVYKQIKAGVIPLADVGFDVQRIDPALWVAALERKNVHLAPPSRRLRAA